MVRAIWLVLLAAVLVLAGCTSDPTASDAPPEPTPAPTATALPTPEPTIENADPTPQPTTAPTPVADEPTAEPVSTEFLYAVALPRDQDDQIPVYDEPGGIERTLLDVNSIDNIRSLNPLYATTFFRQPLVLRVRDDRSDKGWLQVQVPTRPNHSHAWVRSDDFELHTTNVWIEASIRRTGTSDAGTLWVYRGNELIFEADVASGRDSRPTPLTTGWVGQFVEGASLSPAYGSWIIDLGTFSEALGTFGGGGSPLMVIHGTNQPELIGMRISSGAFRVENGQLDDLVAIDGLLGAPIYIHEGPQLGVDALAQLHPTAPATTTNWSPDAARLPITPL